MPKDRLDVRIRLQNPQGKLHCRSFREISGEERSLEGRSLEGSDSTSSLTWNRAQQTSSSTSFFTAPSLKKSLEAFCRSESREVVFALRPELEPLLNKLMQVVIRPIGLSGLNLPSAEDDPLESGWDESTRDSWLDVSS